MEEASLFRTRVTRESPRTVARCPKATQWHSEFRGRFWVEETVAQIFCQTVVTEGVGQSSSHSKDTVA